MQTGMAPAMAAMAAATSIMALVVDATDPAALTDPVDTMGLADRTTTDLMDTITANRRAAEAPCSNSSRPL